MAFWPNGLGSTLGDTLVVQAAQMWVSGDVWWVDGNNSEASDSNDGRERNAPLATLAQAVTNAADQDIIVLMDGHTETITSTIGTNTTGLQIIGEGRSDGKPTVKLTFDMASGIGLSFSAQGVSVRNIWFPAQAQANASAKINFDSSSFAFQLLDCYFEADENSDGGVEVNISDANAGLISGCTFISTATDAQNAPELALSFDNVTIFIRDTVFDNGTVGWGNYYAMENAPGSAATIYAQNISLLRGADILLDTDAVGHVHVGTATGAAKIDFAVEA